MVIFDTVNAAPLAPRVLLAGKGAASSATNLINVSISRARGKLVVIANVAYFKQHDADSVVSQGSARGDGDWNYGADVSCYNPKANPSLRGSAAP